MEKLTLTAFKMLSMEEQLDIMNTYIAEIYASGKTTREFSELDTCPVDFSYSSWQKYIKPYGYVLDRGTKQYTKKQEIEGTNNELQKTATPNKEPQVIAIHNKDTQEIASLNKEELKFVKQLYREHVKQQSNTDIKATALVVPVRKGEEKKTTGVSVYKDLWDRFNAFKDTTAYSGTDLLALALEEFLTKYQK